MSTITGHDIIEQIKHWLRTPVNAYLGSSYGNDLKSVIGMPFGSGAADSQINKLLEDVPALQSLPDGSVNLYSTHNGIDRTNIIVEVSGSVVAEMGMGI